MTMIARRLALNIAQAARPPLAQTARQARWPLRTPGRIACVQHPRRGYASKIAIDDKIEEIQELYATAKDEFDIAIEETEKQTVYAEEDRNACREELDKLNAAYKEATEGPDKEMANEIRQRIGQRIRELVTAVERMEEMAQEQD